MDIKGTLEDHRLWLEGKGGQRANLRDADLMCANLRGVDLRGVDLRGAYLSGAYLSGANLSGANLRGVDLRDTNLRNADLMCANLRGADLRCADLSGADLRCAYLSGANLRCADLSGANLRFCIGNNREIRTVQTGCFVVVIGPDTVAVGCQQHPTEGWLAMTDDQIEPMDDRAISFMKRWKPIILEMVGGKE